MWCVTDNLSDTRHACARGFLLSNFNQAVINKLSNFHEIAQISNIHKNRSFLPITGDW